MSAFLILLTTGLHLLGQTGSSDPLPVRAEIERGPYYVGQAIQIRVAVTAEGDRPELVAPEVRDADLIATGVGLRPISASGIGNVVHQTNLFLYDYRFVPRRAGPLVVPAFRATIGERTGRSEALRIEASLPPRAGRPPDFLGGIGPVRADASARPDVVRVGQEFIYELRLEGVGAIGSTAAPVALVERLERLPLGLEIRPLPVETVDEPPLRSIRYRLRPTRDGEITLPPVSLSTFDPRSGRFQTTLAPSVPIRVVDVPRFDPSQLEFVPPTSLEHAESEAIAARQRVLLQLGLAVGTPLAIGCGCVLAIRWRRRTAAARFARRTGRRLARLQGVEAARLLSMGIVGYLHRAVDRPEGALTPLEAEAGIKLATGDQELAERAALLLSESDRILFSGRDEEQAQWLAEAVAFFKALGRARVQKSARTRRRQRPREEPSALPH